MSDSTQNASMLETYKNFKFRVKLDGNYVAGISKVTGIKLTKKLVNNSKKFIEKRKFQAILLEHGIFQDTEFENWAKRVWNCHSEDNSKVSLKNFSKDIVIEAYNETGELKITFKIFKCWISEFQAMPELDAGSNIMIINTIILENEGWESN